VAFDVALAEEIWTAKYRYVPREGEPEEDFTGTASRVARAVAEAEAPEAREEWRARSPSRLPWGWVADTAGRPLIHIMPGWEPDSRAKRNYPGREVERRNGLGEASRTDR
jgi:hypothetical protein